MGAGGEAYLREVLLNKTVRVRIRDDLRAFCGTLVCTDRDGNVVLNEVVEETFGPPDSSGAEAVVAQRPLHMVMVPGRWIAAVCVSRADGLGVARERSAHTEHAHLTEGSNDVYL
ncbi:hypothetical protein MSPP1_003488 [Malassezia sp. CBS 17886]|nr:hypothetical protein MSPP1_003488 [Malassezia sp. CBS 17886]